MNFSNKTVLLAATLTLLAVLAGCAAKKGTGSYVVLLRDPDGNAGKVIVQSQQGEQTLTEVFKGAALDGKREPFFVMQDQLQRDFGAALAAMPPPPEIPFPLEFATGSVSAMDDRSTAELQRIVNKAKQLNTMDISVIGHTDTTGTPAQNSEIALKRAQFVAGRLRDLGLLPPIRIKPISHGQFNQKVKTGDKVDERANRRVEVILH